MSQESKPSKKEEMRAEYDIRGGCGENTTSGTGKGRTWYCSSQTWRLSSANSQSVNRALRMLIDLARKQVDDTSPGS